MDNRLSGGALFAGPGFQNDSGIKPTWYNVLVKLDPVAEKKGLVYIPETARAMEQSAETHCTLYAVGPLAFTGSDGELIPDAPKPGDRVIIGKYSGAPPKAGDTRDLFRLIADKDVIAIIEG